MLENARRQLLLVVLAAAGAILALALIKPTFVLGLDLQGGTQLIYEVDIAASIEANTIPEDASEAQIVAIVEQTVSIIRERIDPQGTLDAVVTRRGDRGILIELPKMDEAETRAIESRIETLGRLDMRMVAIDSYRVDGVPFDIATEKQRLQAWLDKNEGENRTAVAADPTRIALFNNLPAGGAEGSLSPFVKWYPRILEPSVDDPNRWDSPESWAGTAPNPNSNVVPAFTITEWSGGVPPEYDAETEPVPFLVEFMPINTHEVHFEGSQLDGAAVRRGIDDYGKPCINYRFLPDAQTDYANFSEKYKNERCAIILNGNVLSAPTFITRISGQARITSQNFTNRQVDGMVKNLRTGSLQVKPLQVSRDVIGATLGAKSVRLALFSILGGAAFVLLFILAYYRLAGVVAFSGIILNILLILGVVSAIRATLTLPGLAGLVLTMGMAIDANILIYERIREELARGKELLQAVRTGFDRAIVTILDANITTFLAGLVLFNVGVGPIRGFAVTLMIGIMTTLFTAFFASRLVFHYLLERRILTEFKGATWLRNPHFDFLGKSRVALTLSAVVIVAGLFVFASVDDDTKLAIDFTGGANLKVALAEPMSAEEMRDLLAGDPAFKEQFPKPVVNTVDELDAEGRASTISIRLKLTDEDRLQIEEDRKADPNYVPPYRTELERLLAGKLVQEPYEDASVDPSSNDVTDFALIVLHFQREVDRGDLEDRLDTFSSLLVTPDPKEADIAKNFTVEWDVAKGTKATALFPLVEEQLMELTGADGEAVKLSAPIPESSEIGDRMVGELRNSAISALAISLFLIVMFIRIRFHEYKYGLAAVAALLHDVLVTLGIVVAANAAGIVDAELDLAMIAAFLTIIGYSINDTIVIFDRVRENLSEATRLGERIDHKALLNKSINQTLSRTILTTTTTLFVVLTQFVVNYGSGTALEGFSFALVVGLLSGTYSTIFVASPVVLWLWRREGIEGPDSGHATTPAHDAPVATAGT